MKLTKRNLLVLLCSVMTVMLLAGCDTTGTELDEIHQFAIDFNREHHDDSNAVFFEHLSDELMDMYGEEVMDYGTAVVEDATEQVMDYGNALAEQATIAVNDKIDEYTEKINDYADAINDYSNQAIEFGSYFITDDGMLDVEKTTDFIIDSTDDITAYGNAVVEDIHEKAVTTTKQLNDSAEAFMNKNAAAIDAYSDTIDAMLDEEGDEVDINNAYGILNLDKEGSQAVADGVLGFIGAQTSGYYIDKANEFVNNYAGDAIKTYSSLFGKQKKMALANEEANALANKMGNKKDKTSDIISGYGTDLANGINNILDAGYYSSLASELINQTGDGIKSSGDYIAMGVDLVNEYGSGFDANYYTGVAADVMSQIDEIFNSGEMQVHIEFMVPTE